MTDEVGQAISEVMAADDVMKGLEQFPAQMSSTQRLLVITCPSDLTESEELDVMNWCLNVIHGLRQRRKAKDPASRIVKARSI